MQDHSRRYQGNLPKSVLSPSFQRQDQIEEDKLRTIAGITSFLKFVSDEDISRDLVLDNDHISRMEKGLRDAIDKGLDKEGHNTATVKCFPTYVRELPSGYEVSQVFEICIILFFLHRLEGS